jgi:multidrug resistance efflux pump
MPNEELPAPGAAAPPSPAPADAPAGSRTAALDDPFVITASGERMPVAAAGGAMEIRRRGESAAYTLEESEGGTRMRARGLDGGTPSFGADAPAPQPPLAQPSGTPAAPDSSGAEGGAHAVEGHTVQALAAPVLVTEAGEKIVMDGRAPDVSIRRKPGDEADGPQRLTLGLDGKPMDPRDAGATRAGADASPSPSTQSPPSVVPAQRSVEPAPAPPASSASSNAAALAAARRLIIGGAADTASTNAASPAPAPPAGSGPASKSADPPAATAPATVDPTPLPTSVEPSAAPAAGSAAPPTPVEPAAPAAAIAAVSVPAPQVDESAAPMREGASELERSGRTSPLQRGDDAPVDVRSEEMDEILTMIPGVLVRYGISAVFGTLAILLVISWFIAYPDVVKGKVVLTTPTPPVRVVARAPGEVERVFVADRATVAPGAPLVLLRSPARYADVTALATALDRLEPSLVGGGPVPAADLNPRMVLGDVQPAYTAFLQAYSDYRVFTDDGFHAQKVASLRRQVADHESLRGRLAAQQTVQEQQLALAERARDRVRQMAAQQLAATADVEKAEQDFLQTRYAVENGRSALTSNEIQLTSSQSALLDLEQRRSGDGQRLLTELRSAHRQLRAAMATWEQQYLVRAPVAGTVSYFRDLNENQYVAAAEALVAVVPSGSELVGRVQLQGAGAGKVAVGQRVLVRLEGYPYRQYGVLEGRVQSVSQLGFEQGERSEVTYRAVVSLSNGLMTSYGRRLQFREEMRGDIDVITEDMRLLERLFNQFRSLRTDG